MSLTLVAWSLTIAALIHIFEEFVFPGGFKAWWCAYRPEIAASVTNRFLVIINVVLIVFSATVGFAAQRRATASRPGSFWLRFSPATAFSMSSVLSGRNVTRRKWFPAFSFTSRSRSMVTFSSSAEAAHRRLRKLLPPCSELPDFLFIANHRRRARTVGH